MRRLTAVFRGLACPIALGLMLSLGSSTLAEAPKSHYATAANAKGRVAHTAPAQHVRQARHNGPAPYAGTVNYAHTSPTFRWGWFGAEHFYPTVHWHRDYNGEVVRWSRHRRY